MSTKDRGAEAKERNVYERQGAETKERACLRKTEGGDQGRRVYERQGAKTTKRKCLRETETESYTNKVPPTRGEVRNITNQPRIHKLRRPYAGLS